MNRRWRAAVVVLPVLALAACSDPAREPEAQDGALGADVREVAPPEGRIGATTPRERPTMRTNYQGEFVPVPSDANASYRVLANDRLPSGNIEVMTRRDGRDGTRYGRWEFDCAEAAFRLLGQGAAVDAALEGDPESANFAPLSGDSIAADIARYACPK